MYYNLRKLRHEKNISLEELKKSLKLKTDAAYYKKEKGLIKFSLEEAKIISNILNLPIEIIFLTKVSKKEI